MLQDIRKSSQGTAAKIIVGLIIVTFALFGVESIVGSMAGEPEVASVNGEDIAESAYKRALEGKRRQILAQMGASADPDLIDMELLESSVLEGLIEQKVLELDAQNKDLYVADAAVDRYIANIDQFKVDGTFSNERLQMLLRNAGLTLKGYRDSLRTEFMTAQPRSALIASSFLLDDELNDIVAIDRQERDFAYLTVKADSYLDSVVVNDSEVQAYYEDNKESFVQPESVDVSYIVIRQSDLEGGVEVSESELQALYESEVQLIQTEEKRDASHILIKIDDSRSEADALAQIESIRAKLESGDDFAGLAKEFSEDEGSAGQGGSLGAAGKGVYVADFEDALFALQEGDVSAPVKTEFGYHLIKLDRIVASDAPSLAELRPRLEQQLRSQKAGESYAELANQLADISYASPDLQEPAGELGLEVKQLVGVSSESTDPIFSSVKVQRQLFDPELVQERNNSELIEVESGVGLVFRVDDYQEPGIKDLAQVEADIRALLQQQKASEFAASVGQAFAVRVQAGEEAVVVAEDMGLDWLEEKSVSRNSRELDQDLLKQVFAMDEVQEVIGFESADGDYFVARLVQVHSGDVGSLSTVERNSISRIIGESKGASDYQGYQQVALDGAEIERI